MPLTWRGASRCDSICAPKTVTHARLEVVLTEIASRSTLSSGPMPHTLSENRVELPWWLLDPTASYANRPRFRGEMLQTVSGSDRCKTCVFRRSLLNALRVSGPQREPRTGHDEGDSLLME